MRRPGRAKPPDRALPGQLGLFDARPAAPNPQIARPRLENYEPEEEPLDASLQRFPPEDDPRPPQDLEPGRFGQPSAHTGGWLSAIEAARVRCGLSIAVGGCLLGYVQAGTVVEGGAVCARCKRRLVGYIGWPLFEPFSRHWGALEGERFTCGSCGNLFTAHRDESLRWKPARR